MEFLLKEIEEGLFKTGFKEDTYNEFLPVWIKENGDSERSRKDYIWYCYNLLLNEWAKQATTEDIMYREQRKVYLQMINFRRLENKNPTNVTKAFNFCDLQINKLSGLNCMAIILGGNRCSEMYQIDKMELTIYEALENQIIPYKLCKREGGCNCCYTFRVIK